MGAGSPIEHFYRDLAESFWVLECQKYLASLNINISSVEERQMEFDLYCVNHNPFPDGINPEEKFYSSCYAKNVLKHYKTFVDELIYLYPNHIFDFIDCECACRNLSQKADFKIIIKMSNEQNALKNFRDFHKTHTATLEDVFRSSAGVQGWCEDNTFHKEIPVSLKNYACDPGSIQLCSGTWHSLINNFALTEGEGPGNYICSITGDKYSAQRKTNIRNKNYEHIGLADIIPCLDDIDKILTQVKQKYVFSEDTRYWNPDVAARWDSDQRELGNQGVDIILKALNLIPNEQIKKKILEKSDIKHNEELLVIGGNSFMCSLFNEKYKQLIIRANSEESKLEFARHEKNVRMRLVDSQGEILKIDIPICIQKNGCWWLPSQIYEGTQYHQKENVELRYGERRPKKSREVNTSTNMWFSIKKYI